VKGERPYLCDNSQIEVVKRCSSFPGWEEKTIAKEKLLEVNVWFG